MMVFRRIVELMKSVSERVSKEVGDHGDRPRRFVNLNAPDMLVHERTRTNFVVIAVAANTLSSVVLVMLNKVIYNQFHFHFGISLDVIHFLFTFVGVVICHLLHFFRPKKLPWVDVTILSISFCLYVVSSNLTLEYNSLGIYEAMKILSTPAVVLINTKVFSRVVPISTKITLVPITIGVALVTVTDVDPSILGLFVALCAIFVIAFHQILVGQKHRRLDCSSLQLLYYQTPLASLFLILLMPVLHAVPQISPFTRFTGRDTSGGEDLRLWTVANILLVGLSGLVSFFYNVSSYIVLAKTSALTYQVVGHFKTLLVFFCGIFFFGEGFSQKHVWGIIFAVSGILSYSIVRYQLELKSNKELPSFRDFDD